MASSSFFVALSSRRPVSHVLFLVYESKMYESLTWICPVVKLVCARSARILSYMSSSIFRLV